VWGMQQMIVDLPGMYADHHVLRVRQVLLGTQGVKEVTASAARRKEPYVLMRPPRLRQRFAKRFCPRAMPWTKRPLFVYPRKTQGWIDLVCTARSRHHYRAKRS